MLRDFTVGEIKTDTYYRVEFFIDRSGGLSFPCDENGNPDFESMTPAAVRNYENAMQHPEKYPYCFNEVRSFTERRREESHGKCHCGETVWLTNQYMGACQCPKCGQWYNLFGQELNPPDMWEEDLYELDY